MKKKDELQALHERMIACGVRSVDRRGNPRITVEAVVERLEELTDQLAQRT